MSGIVVDGLRWEVRVLGSGRPALLLHGFTGRATSWGDHATALARHRRVIAVDLPGHGRSGIAEPARLSVERSADDLAIILERLAARPADVIGYSLGARIALRLAVAHPEAVSALLLESPSAGIADAAERARRRGDDEALAVALERDGIEAFVDAWERQPIFASQATLPAVRAARQRATRLANRPAGLAASLRGAGQGTMEPLHERLRAIAVPTLVVTGALDDRGRPRAEAVARAIPGARAIVIDGAGHTPHIEQPGVFRRHTRAFLEEVAAV